MRGRESDETGCANTRSARCGVVLVMELATLRRALEGATPFFDSIPFTGSEFGRHGNGRPGNRTYPVFEEGGANPRWGRLGRVEPIPLTWAAEYVERRKGRKAKSWRARYQEGQPFWIAG
jgi:hypothetical protein